MGFFSDLGKGLGSIIKAPFQGVAAVVKGVGQGIGSILHGSRGQRAQPYLAQSARQAQGRNPVFAGQLDALQRAMMQHMACHRAMYPQCCLR